MVRKTHTTDHYIDFFNKFRVALQHPCCHYKAERNAYNCNPPPFVPQFYERGEVVGQIIERWLFANLIKTIHTPKARQVRHGYVAVSVEVLNQPPPALQHGMMPIHH